MSYTPPLGNAVDFLFGSGYSATVGNSVNFEFAVSASGSHTAPVSGAGDVPVTVDVQAEGYSTVFGTADVPVDLSVTGSSITIDAANIEIGIRVMAAGSGTVQGSFNETIPLTVAGVGLVAPAGTGAVEIRPEVKSSGVTYRPAVGTAKVAVPIGVQLVGKFDNQFARARAHFGFSPTVSAAGKHGVSGTVTCPVAIDTLAIAGHGAKGAAAVGISISAIGRYYPPITESFAVLVRNDAIFVRR